jgi:phosphoribosyl 1,2-cyclic phosphodiesterase
MRFSVLGSGSGGNATLVQCGDEALLIDCGLSLRQLERRMALLAFPPAAIAAILITHEHDDHIAGAAAFSRKYSIPVLTSHGTQAAAAERLSTAYGVDYLIADADIDFGVFNIRAVRVPHDAREPCQFVISDGTWRFGILTDVGQITPHLLRSFATLDALVLEFNHDVELLAGSVYPPFLRERIGGPYGHLSNHQALGMLQRLDVSRLRTLVAAHLSEKTNCPKLVAGHLREQVPAHIDWAIANQHQPLPWCELRETSS